MSDVVIAEFKATDSNQHFYSELENKQVLIIDDLSDMRVLLKSLMVNLGYGIVHVVPSSKQAFEKIRSTQYDLILCDYNLGENFNGQHILEYARRFYSTSHTCSFVMVTADTSYENVVGVMEYEPDGYLVKPFLPNAFQRRIERVIEQKLNFAAIDNARSQKDYPLVEELARKIMAQQPQYLSLCLKAIGESLTKRGLFEQARKHYYYISQDKQNYAWAYFHLALCDLKLGSYELAIEHFKKTLDLNKHFLTAYDHLATAYEAIEELTLAQKTLMDVLAISSRSIERNQRLGKISLKLNDWEVAETTYGRIIRQVRETDKESFDRYYVHLRVLTKLIEKQPQDDELTEKFRRSLFRLRAIAKHNPVALSNSYRAELQRYLIIEQLEDAIRVWREWDILIRSQEAAPLNHLQELNIKRKLGLVIMTL